MNDYFIKNIEIENYKCFKNFKADGFKRVNLIGGKNNSGKTAFMEACFINIHLNTSRALASFITTRYQIDLYSKLFVEVGIKYIYNFLHNEAKKYQNYSLETNIIKKTIQYNEDDILIENDNTFFIDSIKTSTKLLEKYYSKIIENRLENKIDEFVNKFDSSLDSFRIISSEAKCSLKTDGKFYNINEFGDGLHKYVTFICLLYGIKNTVVFIDEMENGIHYSQFDDLWNIILTISKERNIQIFITTHSKELIDSYNRITKKLNDKDTSFIEFGKDKDNNIKANVMDFEEFNRNIEIGNGVRGW